MSVPSCRLAAAAATSTGRVRATNEDRHLLDSAHTCFAIADGVGGLPYGERASECAVRTLTRELAQTRSADASGDLTAIVAACHDGVRRLGCVLSPRTGIGTTLTVLRFVGATAYLGHVGDSVAYFHPGRDQSLRRLTTDHSVAPPSVLITGHPSPTFVPPPRLDRYLGQSTPPVCDLLRLPAAPRDRFILCSDGVTRAMDETELAALSSAQATPANLARALVHIADLRGGLDNATCLVIDLL
jgi:protein phosphatase